MNFIFLWPVTGPISLLPREQKIHGFILVYCSFCYKDRIVFVCTFPAEPDKAISSWPLF